MTPFDETDVAAAPEVATAIPAPTSIAALRRRVEQDPDLSATRRRDLLSALSSYARHLGLDPERDPPSFGAQRAGLERFSPAAAGISDKTWRTVCAGVSFVFRRYGVPTRYRSSPADLAPAWRAL
jgi:hypothetical protein